MDLYKLLFFSIHIPTILLDGDLNRPTRALLVQDITFSFMRYAFDDFALLHSLILKDKLIIFHPLLKFT